ncbi:HAMP domain-containing sensor histidine kinase [Rhizobium oryzicola]|uniref:histidine kinase n=1 Tax=Rhizobium oryzicola TaxID=1232668 RepID=A0ABT8SSX8_9HYPH|nr:HAMP domain-containing sensor histidine kinase [Rhizobium oryzicola]MDO1581502.1 HAMP domain-containing sensor histidine kinase [Rhizobium oryzicola]
MRVLTDIGRRLVSHVDRVGLHWLQRMGEGDTLSPSDAVVLRRITIASLLLLPLLTLALMPLVGLAFALPLAAALGSAACLCLMAATLSILRHRNDNIATAPVDATVFLDHVPGVTLILDAQGIVQSCAGRDRDLLPSAIQMPEGRALAELVHVSDRLPLAQALDLLRQGAPKALVDVRVERGPDAAAGRQLMNVQADLSALRDGEGALVQVLVQLRDASAERQLRDDLAIRSEEAQSAHEAKSRFLAAVSHELRTPLNAILGFSDVLAGEYFGRLENDRQREYVALIRQSGAHLLSVVNTMLDMSRIEAGRYELVTEPFRIADAVETCRAMLDLQAKAKGITLTARVARGLDEVVADRRAVQQILINLAGNAIKFTNNGGVVSIDAVAEGESLKITVSDTGIGIAPEKIALIGQPFMQVQDDYARAYEGTGLGLALVKGLVALHGGTFVIESRVGEGTVIAIRLPLNGVSAAPSTGGSVEAIEFPPRLHKSQGVTITVEQEAAHDRAKAKTA